MSAGTPFPAPSATRSNRVPDGQTIDATTPALLTGLVAPAHTDLPPADGGWTYAATSLDDVGNESGFSNPGTAPSDRTPPGDPVGLVLAIEADGVRADWTPDAVDPADTYSLYRDTAPIATLDGRQPVQTGLSAPTAFDRPPADGNYHYAVEGLDAIANASNFAAAGPITFDQAAPLIIISGVSDGQVAGQPLTITFSAMDFDLQSLSATLDGAPFISGNVVDVEGDHILVASAEDGSGNTSEETIDFAIDLTDPLISVTGVSDGVLFDVPVTPVITVTDDRLVGTSILLNGLPFVSGTTLDVDDVYTLDVQATDEAGNVASTTVGFTLDAPPPAPDFLSVELPQNGFPVLDWTPRPESDVVGYRVRRDGNDLTPAPIPLTTLTDNTFDPFSVQVYQVVAVDAAGNESPPRTATLSLAGLTLIDYGTARELSRGYVDSIGVSVVNAGASALSSLELELTLRDGAATLGTRTLARSDPLDSGDAARFDTIFPAGEGETPTRLLDLVLTLPSEQDSEVRLVRTEILQVREPPPPIEVFSEPVVLGATGRFRLKLFNHGSVTMQVVTARSGAATSDVVAGLLDRDGNLLAVEPLDQSGAGTISTSSLTFVEIAPGSSFLTAEIQIPVPTVAGSQVVLDAAVETTHTDLLGFSPPDVTGSRLAASAELNTGEPAYLAAAVTDKAVYDEGETILISGQVFDTSSGQPVPDAVVKIGVNTRGFDRSLFTVSDANGDFQKSFEPVPGEAGHYSVWATHPTVVERSSQATFDILGLALTPRAFNLRMSKNDTFPLSLGLTNSGETDVSGLSFDALGGNGVTGTVETDDLPSTLAPGDSATITLLIETTIDAADANFLTLQIDTAEGARRFFDVSLALLPAVPAIHVSPGFVEIGLNNGELVTKTVRIENRGFAPLEGIVLDPPEQDWVTLGVDPALDPIPAGGFADVPVIFAPPAELPPAIYSDRFNITSANHPTFRENLFAIVTSSTTGEALFELRNTENVLLPGASVWIQNLEVPTLSYSMTADIDGLARFQELPTGPYQFRVQSPGTEPAVGRFEIDSDQVSALNVFNNVVYVTLDWSVTPVIIEDRYDVTVTATFETSVPAPVLIAEPAFFRLEVEPGGTYVGEYTLRNFGLVALDDILITPSAGEGGRLETLVSEIPRLGAMRSVTIPFRVTLDTFEFPLPGARSASKREANPCDPYPARVDNFGIYTCLAGFEAGSSALVEFTMESPETESIASALGFCDSGCDPCDCAASVGLGAICKCIQSPSACGCLDAAGVDTGAACGGCTGSGAELVECLTGVSDPVADMVGKVKNLLGCARCVCKLLPGLCEGFEIEGGTTGRSVSGTGETGGYGGGFTGVKSSSSCDDG